jgi:hypothetical protein
MGEINLFMRYEENLDDIPQSTKDSLHLYGISNLSKADWVPGYVLDILNLWTEWSSVDPTHPLLVDDYGQGDVNENLNSDDHGKVANAISIMIMKYDSGMGSSNQIDDDIEEQQKMCFI